MTNNILLQFFAIILSLFCFAPYGRADPPICNRLDPKKQAVFSQLLASLHPYACCDTNFESCLRLEQPAPLVVRLSQDICRMFQAGKTASEIKSALTLRARSVLAFSKPTEIATDPAMMAGAQNAPVTVVVYACTRCPFCKELVPTLYREVTRGSLHGNVRLFFKPFPLKNHPGSIEGGLGLVTAAKMNRFWPYALHLFANFESFRIENLHLWAAETGMDQDAFASTLSHPATRRALLEAKKEGLRHKVLSTPAIFINGQKYVYEMTAGAILDVLAEVVQKQKGNPCGHSTPPQNEPLPKSRN